MKTLTVLLGAWLLGGTVLAGADTAAPAAANDSHRFVVERTFPAGALDGLDAALKAKVNANNAKLGVH